MALDVEAPEPPSLGGPEGRGDYDAVEEFEDPAGDDPRREALSEFLRDGAWINAFDRWRRNVDMSEREWDLVLEHGLVDEFDFYWNPAAGDVGYLAPDLPAEFGEDDEIDRQTVEEALDELGHTVSVVLETDYVDRTGEDYGFFEDQE